VDRARRVLVRLVLCERSSAVPPSRGIDDDQDG